MDSRSDHGKITKSNRRPVSFQAVQDKEADRTFYLKDTVRRLHTLLTSSARELYNSLSMAFSLDHIDFHSFKQLIWPVISSGAAFIIGEYVTARMSQDYTDSDDYDFVFKFILGSAILGYCAVNRITEKKLESPAEISAAVASEVLAITYLYSSTFNGSRMLLQGTLSDSYSLIASFGVSALAVPGSVAYLTRKLQEKLVKKLYLQGAQRSDTTLIPSGLTPVSNIYFQANHFIASELAGSSRLFQLGLISDNILNAQKILQRFRNLPALIADIGPSTIKKLLSQQEKIEADYKHNTAIHKVLRFTKNGPEFLDVPRYKLRNGDLVYCDDHFDFSAVPISGEIISLQRDEKGQFTQNLEQKKFSVNLKAHNGEDTWIELKSKLILENDFKQVDLHAIHKGKQAGILVGDKLNLYGGENFFIEIKSEKERTMVSEYEKKSIINQMITERKQRNVLYSILCSIVMAGFLSRDITKLPTESIRLLFNLFHMMIQFSETILREMVNSRLMKEINDSITDNPMETIDALRIVDLCNALGGYYREKFPKGVAIVSDKTGTLTTSEMDVLGLWTKDMRPDVQDFLNEDGHARLLPDEESQMACLEVFATAYTNEKKELEPEEHSILERFKSLLGNKDCLNINIEGNNHFIKTLQLNDEIKSIETFHLGLYRSLGGRLTLADDGQQQYLVFCGVPKQDKFKDTPLLASYRFMQARIGVLSRDWCIARTSISREQFDSLKAYFDEDDKKQIEDFILSNQTILDNLVHYCTFIVDNPVKKGAEKFISQCRDIYVPVFIATGDTAKAAENIAKVLCPANTQKIITIHASEVHNIDLNQILGDESLENETIIFSGVSEEILKLFGQLLEVDRQKSPVIIFSEMSTEGKGILTQYLKNNHFFVVANGDGSNDVLMMKHADIVISHLVEDEKYAPGVGQLSNMSDKQLREMFNSEKSFYELFDIHQADSFFIKKFTPLANAQIMPTIALTYKTSKMGFELAQAVGVSNIVEMPHQHWFSVAFDMVWFWISFHAINSSADLPVDNKSISSSHFLDQCMLVSMVAACLQAIATYALTGESTNLTTMVIMLTLLPIILKSVLSAFGEVQNQLYPADDRFQELPQDKERRSRGSSLFNLFHNKKVNRVKARISESDNSDDLGVDADYGQLKLKTV